MYVKAFRPYTFMLVQHNNLSHLQSKVQKSRLLKHVEFCAGGGRVVCGTTMVEVEMTI